LAYGSFGEVPIRSKSHAAGREWGRPMVAPATSDAFLDVVRKSGLIDAGRLDTYLSDPVTERMPDQPLSAARQLIRDGLLTQFQGNQLLQGKWRGFTFGKYRVLERLGSSANSNVYLCEHLVMHRRVAVKVLPTVKAEDPGALARFHREARAAAALDHPNIVHAYDSDQDGELHFIVMEYVDGFSLQEIVQKHGALSVRRAAHYISQAATALQSIHDSGLIHRDIKPGNLLLDRGGCVRILDLGLARFYQDHIDELTQKYDANNILGTADYLSPEQARDSHDVDTRTDIYSLGATLYFMLTARPPFEGKTVTQKLMAHQLKEPTPLRELRPNVPEALAAVVKKMMTKDPALRYQSAEDIINALQTWTSEPIAVPPEDEMPKLCIAAQLAGTADSPARRSSTKTKALAARVPVLSSEFELVPPDDRRRSSSAITLWPSPPSTPYGDVPSPSAETDDALPRTETKRDLPRTPIMVPQSVRQFVHRPVFKWAMIAGGLLIALCIGFAIAIQLK
jgi:serine/threonine protein kinase